MNEPIEDAWLPIRVYYEDTDASGVVYHASYLRFFERARTEWLRALGYSQQRLVAELAVAFTVSTMSLRFLSPARLDDELEVGAVVVERRHASLVFDQQLRRVADRCVLAMARVRVACVDSKRFRPRALPPALARAISMTPPLGAADTV